MSLQFIDLVTPKIGRVDVDRHHTLALSHDWPGLLQTLGVIQHCDAWRPTTARDRDRLVEFLENLNYHQCKGCGRDEDICSNDLCADVIKDRES